MTLGRNLTFDIVTSNVFSEILFSNALFLNCFFHSSKFKLDLSDNKKKLEKKFNVKIEYLEFRDEKNLKLNKYKRLYS